MESLGALLFVGLIIWIVFNSGYVSGKREGSRKGYGVGFDRGRKSQSGCMLALLFLVASLTFAAALSLVGCGKSGNDVTSPVTSEETGGEQSPTADRVSQDSTDPASIEKLDVKQASAQVTTDDFSVSEMLSEFPGGIGVRCKLAGDYPVVTEILPGGPGAESGKLKTGDQVEAVTTERGHSVDLKGKDDFEVSCYFAGRKGTKLKLVVRDQNDGKLKDVVITRGRDKHLVDDDGTSIGFDLQDKKTGTKEFLHYTLICRFPGSPRFYALVPEALEATLKAYPEKIEGKRVAFVTPLLFPEVDTNNQRVEVRLFDNISSARGYSFKRDQLFPDIIEKNPRSRDVVVIHAKMVKYSNSNELYGHIEEMLFLDPDKPGGLVPIGITYDYDDTPGAKAGGGSSGGNDHGGASSAKRQLPFTLADVAAVLGRPDQRNDAMLLYSGKFKVTRTAYGMEFAFDSRDSKALLFAAGLFTSNLFSRLEGSAIIDVIDNLGSSNEIGRFRVEVTTAEAPYGWRLVKLAPRP